MVSKNFVAMVKCFFCGEVSHILVHEQMKDVSKLHNLVHDMAPCSKCKELMGQGVILIGISAKHSDHGWHLKPDRGSQAERERWIPNPFRTGAWVVVSDAFIQRTFHPPELAEHILRCRWTFIEHEAVFRLGLFHHDFEMKKIPYRQCACDQCEHHWLYEVELSAETANLSGETTPWCPICKKRAAVAGPIIATFVAPTATPKAPEDA